MEYQEPHSQDRCPGKKRQTIWAQSLYILGGLLSEVGRARSLVCGGLSVELSMGGVWLLTLHHWYSTAESDSSWGD